MLDVLAVASSNILLNVTSDMLVDMWYSFKSGCCKLCERRESDRLLSSYTSAHRILHDWIVSFASRKPG